MRYIIKDLINCLLEIIYPSCTNCLNCGVEESEYFLCEKCKKQLKYVGEPFLLDNNKCYSVVYYNHMIKKLVSEFKYKKNFNVGEFFAHLLYKRIIEEKIEFDYITYIPMNKSALRKREFNQCKYLAKKLSEKVGKEVIQMLSKKEGIKEQKTLCKSERLENIKDAFYIDKKRLCIENKKVLLLDDVVTSGATLISSTTILKKYYNIDVFLLTVVKSSI